MSRLWIPLLAAMLLGAPACYDESDACKDFCREMAECRGCPYTDESIDRCKNECIDLSISDQKKLPDCTSNDCANALNCNDIVGFTSPNPCDYGI